MSGMSYMSIITESCPAAKNCSYFTTDHLKKISDIVVLIDRPRLEQKVMIMPAVFLSSIDSSVPYRKLNTLKKPSDVQQRIKKPIKK